MTDRDLRVGYVERDETTAHLAEHFAAGRLDRTEFDERTSQALAARTRGELDDVMADLPSVPAAVPQPESASPAQAPVPGIVERKRAAIAHWRRTKLLIWAVFAVFFVVLWAVTGAGYFWPMWPIMGWGLGVAISGVNAYTGDPPSQDQHQQLPRPPGQE